MPSLRSDSQTSHIYCLGEEGQRRQICLPKIEIKIKIKKAEGCSDGCLFPQRVKTTGVGLCLPNPLLSHPSARLFISPHHRNSKRVLVSASWLVHLLLLSVFVFFSFFCLLLLLFLLLLSSWSSPSQLGRQLPCKWRLQKQGSTFTSPAEDTPVNPFLRRRGSLNNKRAEQTRPFAPGEEGAGAAPPPGRTCGVCYAAAGHARISNLGEIVNGFHTDPSEKKCSVAV